MGSIAEVLRFILKHGPEDELSPLKKYHIMRALADIERQIADINADTDEAIAKNSWDEE